MQNNGRLLHQQAEQAREKGEFEVSLKLLASAIVAYQKEGNAASLSEALSSQALTYRHLFDKTNSFDYIVLSKHSAMAAFDIAKNCDDMDALSIAQYNLGKSLESQGEIADAILTYQKAIDRGLVARPALLAEMKTRLAAAEYKSGDEQAISRFEFAVKELEDAQEKDNYNKNVWLSGAYMHMAQALFEKDKAKARKFLEKAQKVINSDLRLQLREQQLKELKAKLI